jgi:hypothetical protein
MLLAALLGVGVDLGSKYPWSLDSVRVARLCTIPELAT